MSSMRRAIRESLRKVAPNHLQAITTTPVSIQTNTAYPLSTEVLIAVASVHEEEDRNEGKEVVDAVEEQGKEDRTPKCVCEFPNNEEMISCESCGAWYHFNCVQVTVTWASDPVTVWYCWTCQPALHASISGAGTSSQQPSARREATNYRWDDIEKHALFVAVKGVAPFKGKQHVWNKVSSILKQRYCIIRKAASCKNMWLRYESYERSFDERDGRFVVGAGRQALRRSQQARARTTTFTRRSAPVPATFTSSPATPQAVIPAPGPNARITSVPKVDSRGGKLPSSVISIKKRSAPYEEEEEGDNSAPDTPRTIKKARRSTTPTLITAVAPLPSPSPPPQTVLGPLFFEADLYDANCRRIAGNSLELWRRFVGDVWGPGDPSCWSDGFGTAALALLW